MKNFADYMDAANYETLSRLSTSDNCEILNITDTARLSRPIFRDLAITINNQRNLTTLFTLFLPFIMKYYYSLTSVILITNLIISFNSIYGGDELKIFPFADFTYSFFINSY